MHSSDFELDGHEHSSPDPLHDHERRTAWVLVITAVMMVVELIAGYATRSLALTADGWHMGTHVGAMAMALAAYWFARRWSSNRAFSFGTGKIYALGGFTSGLLLGIAGLAMIVEAVSRLANPVAVHFNEALPVAIVGLVVNLVCAKLLGVHHHHTHAHEGEHVGHHDHNLRAAYLHVLADALTSVLAIGALLVGRSFGWTSLDALAAAVGGVVILAWTRALCRESARQLLDASASPELEEQIRASLEEIDDVRVVDLHLWMLAPARLGCIVSLVTSEPRDVAFYRERIMSLGRLHHLTVEVHRCDHGRDLAA